MVTLVVTVDEDLLKRVDASVQPDLAAEGITRDRVEDGVVEEVEVRELTPL